MQNSPGIIVTTRKPDGSTEPEDQSDGDDQGLSACAADLIRAVHAKDESAVASALKAAFEILDSQSPDEEQPNNEEESQ